MRAKVMKIYETSQEPVREEPGWLEGESGGCTWSAGPEREGRRQIFIELPNRGVAPGLKEIRVIVRVDRIEEEIARWAVAANYLSERNGFV